MWHWVGTLAYLGWELLKDWHDEAARASWGGPHGIEPVGVDALLNGSQVRA